VGAFGVGQYVRRQQGRVVRAEDCCGYVVEGGVDQCLVLYAGWVLGCRPARPDRLADDPYAGGVAVRERGEHAGDDAAGVAAALGHVQELDVFGFGAQFVADQVDVAWWYGYEYGLVRCEAVQYEGDRACQVLVGVTVEQRFVHEIDH
jgi:hypothetical protein